MKFMSAFKYHSNCICFFSRYLGSLLWDLGKKEREAEVVAMDHIASPIR